MNQPETLLTTQQLDDRAKAVHWIEQASERDDRTPLFASISSRIEIIVRKHRAGTLATGWKAEAYWEPIL